jgi:hypothetical protein
MPSFFDDLRPKRIHSLADQATDEIVAGFFRFSWRSRTQYWLPRDEEKLALPVKPATGAAGRDEQRGGQDTHRKQHARSETQNRTQSVPP